MLLALAAPSTLLPRALPLMPTTYGAAAGSLATRALLAPGAEAAVLGSTALALLFDFGPSALRDLSTSDAASSAARDELIDVSPDMILIDNFVHNLGAEDDITTQKKEAAQDRLKRAHDWAFLVRARLLGDLVGALLMLRGRVCLGAAALLAAHAAYWAGGAAAARVDRGAEPAPLSPPLAALVGATAAALAGLAALGALAPSAAARAVAGKCYAVALAAVQLARLVADRVRARTHVGL